MVKNFLGIIFIILSLILGLAFLVGIPNNLSLFFAIMASKSGYSVGYFVGNIIFSVFLLVISIYLFKLGLKWLKKKPKKIEIIDQIGKN